MNIEICNKRLEELIKLAEFQAGFLLSLCTLNFVFCIMAILGNLLVIGALWKASLIPDSLKKLFLSLAASDLAVGLFVQPMHGVIIAMILHMASNENYSPAFCPTLVTIYLSSAYLFSVSSFLSIVTIAVDRLLAVSLHLRYHEFVTTRRVKVVLGMLWFTSFLITLVYISLPKYNDIVAVVIEVVGILVTSAAYFRIYNVARYHRNKIHSQQPGLETDAENQSVVRVKRSAYNTFYVYAVFLVCYIPNVICGILLHAYEFNMSFIIAFYITILLIYVNSSVNILVYCWRFREIREIVKATIKNMFTPNEHESI